MGPRPGRIEGYGVARLIIRGFPANPSTPLSRHFGKREVAVEFGGQRGIVCGGAARHETPERVSKAPAFKPQHPTRYGNDRSEGKIHGTKIFP